MKGNPAGWNKNDEAYVVQTFKNNVRFNNIKITGGDAAILVNGATVELTSTVDVSGNDFGGIEVSQGKNVTTPAILKGTSSLNLINNFVVNGEPTIWTDSANTEVRLSNLTKATHIVTGQNQYYLDAAHANIVVTNVKKGTTYGGMQAAVDAASNKDVLEFNGALHENVTIDKSITINGVDDATINGKITINTNAIDVVLSNFTLNHDAEAAVKVPSEVSLASLTLDNVTINSEKAVHIADSGSELSKVGTLTIKNSHITSNYPVYVDHAVAALNVTNNVFTTEHGNRGIVFALQPSPDNMNVSSNTFVIGEDVDLSSLNFVKYEDANKDADKTLLTKIMTKSNNQFKDSQGDVGVTMTADNKAIVLESTIDAVFLNGVNVTTNVRSANCSPVRLNVISKTIDLSALVEDENDVAKVSYKVRKLNANGCTDTAVYQSSTVNMQQTTDDEWITTGAKLDTRTRTDPRMLEGESYTIQMAITDSKGTVTTKYVDILVDNKRPLSVITQPIEGLVTNSDILDISGVATDDNFSFYRYYVLNSEGEIVTPNTVVDTEVLVDGRLGEAIDISKLNDGEYIFRLSTADTVNNWFAVTAKFTIDRTAPEITSSTYNNATKELTVVTNDDADDVVLYVGVNNTELRPISQSGTTWVFNVASFNEPGATYAYTVYASDAAGNVQTTDSVDSITGDIAQKSFTIPDPVIDAKPLSLVSTAPLGFGPVASPGSRSFFVAQGVVIPATASDSEEGVLGAQDEKTQTSPAATVAAIEPSAQGWKLFGFAWFWWLLATAAITAIWWWIAAARRRSQEA